MPTGQKERIETIPVADHATGIQNDPTLSSDHIKDLIKTTLFQTDAHPKPHVLAYRSIEKHLKQKNLVIAKAYKGETLVILARSQYEHKMLEFLKQSGVRIYNYFINTHNSTTGGKMRDALYITTGIWERRERLFYIQNPSSSKKFGQIKTHKAGHLIRPMVAFFTDPTFKLAKYLANWFLAMSGFFL